MEPITVQKTMLNGAEVNSVNARDLYNSLGLAKGQYSRWIQKNLVDQFLYNDDYVGVRQIVEGNEVISHIVNLDTAKHLCMMAKTENAMKFRKYFIECEKQAQKVLSIPEQIQLIALGHGEVQQRVEHIESEMEILKNDIVLTPSQKRILQKSVSTKVYSFNAPTESNKKLFAKVYSKLKDRFAVSSYMEIPRLQFNEAKSMVDNITLIDLV